MAQSKYTVAEAIRDLRINLQYNAETLRRFDQETAEKVARRLDRLRWDLKPLTVENEKQI